MTRSILVASAILATFAGSPKAVPAQEVVWSIAEVDRSLRSDPMARLGALDGDRCSTIGRIRDAAFVSQGRIAIVDGIAQAISIFDAGGRCLYQIGRKGSGPGEFEGAAQLLVSGDTLMVLDPPNRRIHLFRLGDRAGEYLDSTPMPLGATDFCLARGGFVLAGAHADRIAHQMDRSGRLLASFGRLHDGPDQAYFGIARPGAILCGADGSVTAAGFQVPDIHKYGPRNDRRWAAHIPGFIEMEMIRDGNRVTGFRPSSKGLHYTAALVDLGASSALVQIGMPTDGGFRRMSSFVLNTTTGDVRALRQDWPHIWDVAGDRVLVGSKAELPQLLVHRR